MKATALAPVLLVLLLSSAAAQPPGFETTEVLPPRVLSQHLRTIDGCLQTYDLSRAKVLLDELDSRGVPRVLLLPKLVQLHRLLGEPENVVRLAEEALELQPNDLLMLRELGTARLDLGDLAAADSALTRFMAVHPHPASAGTGVVSLWRERGHPRRALDICDSLRTALRRPAFMDRVRAGCLIEAGRADEAADEIAASLRHNRRNLPLVRRELADAVVASPLAPRLIEALRQRAAEAEAVRHERLFIAGVELLRGRPDAAVAEVRPLLDTSAGRRALLEFVPVLVRETNLDQAPVERRASTEFLLATLAALAEGRGLPIGLHQRCLDLLAEVCENALRKGDLADDPVVAVERFGGYLDLVREGLPSSEHLPLAQILLAEVESGQLGRADQAMRRLERLLTDPDLPLSGVALARLALGKAALAAADTARARVVLTSLGRDTEFRQSAGHAHFFLGRLDLAQGHWRTAQERFATVAWDNPRAPYANDALECGLLIAEEVANDTGGPALLEAWAPAVYSELVGDDAGRIAALEAFVAVALGLVDLQQPQYLLEGIRFDLARARRAAGETEAALTVCEDLVRDHPDGRRAPDALALAAALHLERDDRPRAMRSLERLLLQYPEYIFTDETLAGLRAELQAGRPANRQGSLP